MEIPGKIVEMEDARRILRPRREDAHKGDFGHALLVCGSYGMAGAAVLATMGALRSGCGLVTVHLPESERMAIHVTSPSAMVDSDPGGVLFGIALESGQIHGSGMRLWTRAAS